ncbi:MAG: PEP/pyruvate-binding domain-containing protein [Comamonadaceae bacterium]|nr:PEP/pyruvate-binding domain-containing protein [Comamonadaceae bacterium]
MAVRSSAPGEDSQQLSFAGLHESIVGVTRRSRRPRCGANGLGLAVVGCGAALSTRAVARPEPKPDGGARPGRGTGGLLGRGLQPRPAQSGRRLRRDRGRAGRVRAAR